MTVKGHTFRASAFFSLATMKKLSHSAKKQIVDLHKSSFQTESIEASV